MSGLLFVLCCAAGLALYFGVVRPFFIPLSWKIPAYRASMGVPARR